jgi:hypothetical protein
MARTPARPDGATLEPPAKAGGFFCREARRAVPCVQMDCRYALPGRHGVLVESDMTGRVLWWETSRTKRGARRAFAKAADWMTTDPGHFGRRLEDWVTVRLVEGRQTARVVQFPPAGGPPPDAGVREPRGTPPSAGGAAATADQSPNSA